MQLCLMDALLREREASSQDFATSSAPLPRLALHGIALPHFTMEHACQDRLPSMAVAIPRPMAIHLHGIHLACASPC